MGLLSYKGLFLIRLLLVFEPFYSEIRCYRSIVQKSESWESPNTEDCTLLHIVRGECVQCISMLFRKVIDFYWHAQIELEIIPKKSIFSRGLYILSCSFRGTIVVLAFCP